MKYKKNNTGYKILCFILGFFVVVTIVMAWIGGLSTIQKKTVKVSAEVYESKVASFTLAPFSGSYFDGSYMISQSSVVFNFDFTNNTYYLTIYNPSQILTNTLTYNSLIVGTSYNSNFSSAPYSNTATMYVNCTNTDSLPTIGTIKSVFYQSVFVSQNSGYWNVYIDCTTLNNSSYTITLRFNPSMPFYASYSTTYGFTSLNLTPDSYSSLLLQQYYENGFTEGKSVGKDEGLREGEIIGYNRGTAEGVHTFKDLMNGVFFAPFHFLYSLLNVDLLGVNIYNLFTAVITIGLLSFVVRLFL